MSVVGYRYNGLGTICRCTRYVANAGYDMRVLARSEHWSEGDRDVGAVFNVSERAIGRTYHVRLEMDEQPAEHEQPCDCHVCKPAEKP